LIFKENIRNKIIDISQVNMEKMIRKYGEEEVVRLMNVIMENNVTMLKLQKQILELQVVAEEKKRRQKDREQRRREYEERKEKKEEKKRIDKEWRRVEERKAEKEWRQQEM